MQASFLEWTFLQRVAVRLAHAYVGVRDASLADRHTKEVDTSERSMPKSKVDRSNIIATRYRERVAFVYRAAEKNSHRKLLKRVGERFGHRVFMRLNHYAAGSWTWLRRPREGYA